MKTLTPSQQLALTARGNVLVVAGAGTGKTRTLVERCVLQLQQGCSWEQILVVTFTEAAAAEMRGRIRARLMALLSGPEGTAHLEEQLALLDVARISTLHSFCLKLVREHFYHGQLRLDPQFAVLAEEQIHQLRHQALDALLDKYYGGDTAEAAAFRQWVTRQTRGSDHRARELIWRLHRYAQSLPDPQGWFDRQAALFGEPQPGRWRAWLAAGFQDWRDQWLPVLKRQPDENTPAALCAAALDGFVSTDGDCPLAAIGPALGQIGRADGDENWPKRKKTVLRGPLKKFFDEAEFLLSLISAPGGEDPLAQDWEWTRHDQLALVHLAREFGEQFSRVKREAGGVDFADLEQFALRLLWDARADRPTPIALRWRAKLKHVFVDEYQDINAAQDRILQALSLDTAGAGGPEAASPEGATPNTGNRFLVGDVKQSIYRFRLAEPAIFRGYKKDWQKNRDEGQAIFLSDNFRSREALLDFINPLFASLMREEIGGIGYEAEAHLKFGSAQERAPLGRAADTGPKVELHLRIKGGEEEFSEPDDDTSGPQVWRELADLEATEKEARLVARRLRELRDQKEQVWDDERKQFRDVQWRDMVVLLRAPANKVEGFAKQFSRSGVPLHAARGGFYETTEISDLLGLLQLLDNPLQDVPALAVLRSPLVGLSLDELAAIRAAGPKDGFWVALQNFNRTPRDSPAGVAGAAGTARGRTRRFLELFESWRRQVRQSGLADCLETILAETHYEALLLAQSRGEERLANVQRLLKLARRFDPYQRQGLFRFLRFVETQREAESGEEPAPPATLDAVRLVSIHQSKGLEFPVVVAADLGKKFNLSDLRAEFLLDAEYGICPRVAPPDQNGHYPSLPYWLGRRRQLRGSLGEELRMLYVALTRAKDRLILAATTGDISSIEHWRAGAGHSPISTEQILSARSYWGWLQLWLAAAAKPGDWRDEITGGNSLLRWTLYSENDARLLDAEKSRGDSTKTAMLVNASTIPEAVVERVSWVYPFAGAALEPAKTSVTAQRQRIPDPRADEETTSLFAAPFRVRGPRRSKTGSLSAAEKGTAHHKFLQFVSLGETLNLEELRREATRMQREQILSSEEIAALDYEALAQFWRSDFGRKVRGNAGAVRRELRFTARFSPQELSHLLGRDSVEPILKEEFVVVQGVVDLAVILPHALWLVDFKTDEFQSNELGKKVEAYEPQLRLYARALERIYQRPVRECALHFFSTQKTVPIKLQ